MSVPRGKFIVVEGADGVGSTTQLERLVTRRRISGRTVHQTREPSKGPIGLLIRQMLGSGRPRSALNRELALLFAADRLDHLAREVEPLLTAGIDVVSDRYVLSSFVYQSLDLPLEWVRELNKCAPQPDVTILITLPTEMAWERLLKRQQAGAPKEIFDQKAVQAQIHADYLRLAKQFSALIVDGQGSIEDVADRVQDAMVSMGVW